MEVVQLPHSGINAGISMGDIVLYILLDADDIVLIADSQEGLQKFLKVLFSFCENYSMMEVNVKKTQVIIFEKRSSSVSEKQEQCRDPPGEDGLRYETGALKDRSE